MGIPTTPRWPARLPGPRGLWLALETALVALAVAGGVLATVLVFGTDWCAGADVGSVAALEHTCAEALPPGTELVGARYVGGYPARAIALLRVPGGRPFTLGDGEPAGVLGTPTRLDGLTHELPQPSTLGAVGPPTTSLRVTYNLATGGGTQCFVWSYATAEGDEQLVYLHWQVTP